MMKSGSILLPRKGRQGHPIRGRLGAPKSPAGAFGSGVFFLVIVLEETKLPADL
jgi:hypothetical protein